MPSESLSEIDISARDLVESYIKRPNHERSTWFLSRIKLEVNKSNGSSAVPDARGDIVEDALKDVRMTISDDCFGQTTRGANDVLGSSVGPKSNENNLISTTLLSIMMLKACMHLMITILTATVLSLVNNDAYQNEHPLELSSGSDDSNIAAVNDDTNDLQTAADDTDENKPTTGDEIEVFMSVR